MTFPAYLSKPAARAALVVAVATLVSGCATGGRSFSTRFVKPGEPQTSFDAPGAKPKTPPTPAGLGEYARKLRTLQANARTTVKIGNTIESSNPLLASALLKLAILPSAANHRQVAQAYGNAGIGDFAHRHFQRALQLDPCDSAAFEGLARLWRQWGAPELALGDAHRAVHCRPDSSSAYNTLGTVLVALGQLEEGRKAFEFAVRLDDRAVFAMNNLCYVALQEGDGPAAQQACERTLALEPGLIAAQTNLALAYAIQGNVPLAEGRLLDHADAATGLYNVGMLRMSMNQYTAAATAFDLASDTRPSLAEAARRAVQARVKAAATKEQ